MKMWNFISEPKNLAVITAIFGALTWSWIHFGEPYFFQSKVQSAAVVNQSALANNGDAIVAPAHSVIIQGNVGGSVITSPVQIPQPSTSQLEQHRPTSFVENPTHRPTTAASQKSGPQINIGNVVSDNSNGSITAGYIGSINQGEQHDNSQK